MEKPDFEVVPDSLRQQAAAHRGRRTPDRILALLEGKTVRLWELTSSDRGMLSRRGFKMRAHRDRRGGGYIVWAEKVESP